MSATVATIANALPPASSSYEMLIKFIKEKQWRAVIDHVRSHPSDAKVGGGSGDDALVLPPLHIACQSGAPIQVIKALLNANPIASQIACGMQDRLPLHFLLAAATSSTAPVQESVVIALVESYPASCRIVDGAGNLPIHLACMAMHASDAIFNSILSMYPEGAYARNHAGMYPLHLAASNGDLSTKKAALAALDRGTIYASISKMTSMRLSMEHESQMKSLEESRADQIRKMEAHGRDERAKLKAQIDGLANRLKEQAEINNALREGMKSSDIRHQEELDLVVQKERANASSLERQLRSELAEVQLRNMDFLDQIEAVQADLGVSNERAEKQANAIVALERKMEETIKILTDTTDELASTSKELEIIQDRLASAQAVSDDKSKRILNLEASLRDARACVLAFANEQERMKSTMNAQKEALTALLMTHDTAMNDMGSLGKDMLQVACKVEMTIGKDEDE